MTALISLTSAPDSQASRMSTPVLSITHGLHQGVSLALDKAAYIIGSAGQADLMLSDPGIAERHVALRFSDGLVAVEALGGDVVVVGRDSRELRVPKGSGHRARMPVHVHVGGARLSLKDTSASAPAVPAPVPAWLRKPQWIIALLLMFLCVGAFAFRAQPLPIAATDSDEPLLAPAAAKAERVQAATQAKAWLEQQLTAADLKQVTVTELDGQLNVQGSYDPTRKIQWRSVQQAFDARYGQQVVMHPSVVARAEVAKPRVRFQAVWFGPNPYVVNDSGKRLYPGAALADDWTLHSIENNQVILARGDERFTFTL